MKNFRKSIIALATVAAMLVPSVAMAATLTTTVDKDITGDVYVGFYDGAVLKDVVKTTVADATVTDAAAAEEATELPATVTLDVVDNVGENYSGQTVSKLVFTAKANAEIKAFNMQLSYDSTKVILATADEYMDDIAYENILDWESQAMIPYTQCVYSYTMPNGRPGTKKLTPITSKVAKVGDRVGLYLTQQSTSTVPLNDGLVLTEIYFRVLDGATVDADTFKIETEIGTGTINDVNGSKGAEVGIKFGDYTYGCWNNGTAIADTIKLVTPWDAPVIPEVTTKTLSVDVPAGAEGYAATMFIWDENQIAQCDPINF